MLSPFCICISLDVREVLEAVTLIVPSFPSCLITHKTFPLKAFFVGEVNFSTQVAFPLSVPTIVPPSTVKVIELSDTGHLTPLESTTSQVTNTKSSLPLFTSVKLEDNNKVVGFPCEV